MSTTDKKRLLLAIESSCDDTSCAILEGSRVLSNVVATQSVHESYGGVVPELASRAHQQNIVPTIHAALAQSGHSLDSIEAVAYTRGPGLMGSLHVGSAFAKSLAMSRNLPFVGVNHMEAHILAPLHSRHARPANTILPLSVPYRKWRSHPNCACR